LVTQRQRQQIQGKKLQPKEKFHIFPLALEFGGNNNSLGDAQQHWEMQT